MPVSDLKDWTEWKIARADLFAERLGEKGIKLRTYDCAQYGVYEALRLLHWELSALDRHNLEPWEEMTLLEAVDLYGESEDLRTFSESKGLI